MFDKEDSEALDAFLDQTRHEARKVLMCEKDLGIAVEFLKDIRIDIGVPEEEGDIYKYLLDIIGCIVRTEPTKRFPFIDSPKQ